MENIYQGGDPSAETDSRKEVSPYSILQNPEKINSL